MFAPKPRDYTVTLNKKVKRLAMKSALSSKVQDNEMIVVDSIATEGYKTKKIAEMLKKETASTLDKVLYELSNQMKNAYSRSDA